MTDEEADIAPAARKVLVVEDDVLLRGPLSDVLRDARLIVFEAADADSALDILNTDPDIALVFADVRIPGGMDGMELASHVKRAFPKVRLMVTSGSVRVRDLPFVRKPYLYHVVLKKIQALLDET